MGSAINLDQIKRFEVTEVYSHPDATVDIILVHGLNGDPRRTWTGKNGVFWPSQLLPVSLKSAQARVLVYGYNADVYTFGSNTKGPSSDMIHQHAQTLLTTVSMERNNAERSETPIIWVAHSLGGILTKRALELSADLQSKNADNLRSIFVSTYGIMFLGTPHTGADAAKWGLILQAMVSALIPRKFLDSHSQLIKTLQANNETLQNINLRFLDIYPRFKVCMVHEGLPTDLKGTKALIVDQSSASPLLPDVQYFGIEATHSGMCKFESNNSPGYANVAGTIKSWIQECLPEIEANWAVERLQRRQKKEREAAQLLGFPPQQTIQGATSALNTPDPATSVNNSTIMVQSNISIEPENQEQDQDHRQDPENAPYFIKPSGFRPNSIFVGRQMELVEMHRLLFDKRRRKEGTSAVLIQSLPGGGKTHLARQYVYEHKDDFPGGVFWVRAKSQTELAAGYWDIARKAALRHMVGEERASSFQDPEQFIRMVTKWLNCRQDWLLVLDGIHFNDTEALEKFIPDSPNTSLIYTSTEKSAAGNYHFKNPQIMKLPLLSAREAQRLLLLELDKKEPFSRDDLKNSTELVQAMGFLPVVIHAVAQRLKATDEPLSKFARSYASEPRLRGLGTYMAVVEQLKALGAIEALNLIYILCFFSQHIPVEMISLGVKALDISVKALEPVNDRSLNNTFKVLNTFALMDRNQRDETVHSSQSSKSSRDLLADNVDDIRLHSVVQGFFADTLAADGTLPIWLGRAVSLFCCSYDMANERIARKAHAGLVEDYRVYEIHGNKLGEHLAKNLSKRLIREHKAILETAQEMLNLRVLAIREEIKRRTPESSSVIAGGKPDAFQTSIFDRTSSSSDTGPETPQDSVKTVSGVSTWGMDPDKSQHESPSSLTHDIDYARQMEAAYRNHLRVPLQEDPGYETDGEGSIAMTVQPSQRTLVQDSSNDLGGAWEEIRPRKQRVRPDAFMLHRTVKTLEKQRYHDSAGAFRAMSAIDPRVSLEVSHETAKGFLNSPPISSRAPSRGRVSGQSNAEVALTSINKQSPQRGGDTTQDKRSPSRRGGERGRMMAGAASYASAVASATKNTVMTSLKDIIRPASEPPRDGHLSTSLPERPSSSAMASLQRLPLDGPQRPASPSSRTPYPVSPYLNPDSDFVQIPGRYSEEDITLSPEQPQSNIYPRMEGLPPVESQNAISRASTTGQDFSFRDALQSESLPASMIFSHSTVSELPNPPFLSLSSPDIKLPRKNSNPYYPGHPEFSNQQGGYTSQPMSRDPSGQSTRSNQSAKSTGQVERRRRPSMAETEPLPQLPVFSPRIAPTSYQVYQRLNERERSREREKIAPAQISPRLGYARAALIEELGDRGAVPELPVKLTDENSPPRQNQSFRPFNPNAPSFSPSPSNFTYSPSLPPNPANSMLSGQSATTSAYPSQYPSPVPRHSPYTATSPLPPQNTPTSFQSQPYAQSITTPKSINTAASYPSPLPPYNTPSSQSFAVPRSDSVPARSEAGGDGEEMTRSGSGGVKVGGGKMIEFGDFPELVDVQASRERVLRSWGEREREVQRRRREGGRNQASRGQESDEVGLGIRDLR